MYISYTTGLVYQKSTYCMLHIWGILFLPKVEILIFLFKFQLWTIDHSRTFSTQNLCYFVCCFENQTIVSFDWYKRKIIEIQRHLYIKLQQDWTFCLIQHCLPRLSKCWASTEHMFITCLEYTYTTKEKTNLKGVDKGPFKNYVIEILTYFHPTKLPCNQP